MYHTERWIKDHGGLAALKRGPLVLCPRGKPSFIRAELRPGSLTGNPRVAVCCVAHDTGKVGAEFVFEVNEHNPVDPGAYLWLPVSSASFVDGTETVVMHKDPATGKARHDKPGAIDQLCRSAAWDERMQAHYEGNHSALVG